MAKKRRRLRGIRGEGYKTYDKQRERWRVTTTSPDGRSRTRYFVEERDADAYHAEQKALIRAGTPPPAARTLIVVFAEYNKRHGVGVASGTVTQYRYNAARIISVLGDIPIKSVTPTVVETLAKKLEETLAAGTINNILNYLYSVCEDMIALEELTRNPVQAYRRIVPKRSRGGKPARKAVILDRAIVRMLVRELLKRGETADMFLIWLMCLPFRVSELRGLRWVNIDTHKLTIDVVEQRKQSNRDLAIPPKTDHGTRTLPVVQWLLDLTVTDRDLVFLNVRDRPLDDQILRRHLDYVLAILKLPYVRIHDLRHTAASNILRMGCPIDYERALLGHAPRDVTEHYAQPDVEALRPYVVKWCEYLFSGMELTQTGT